MQIVESNVHVWHGVTNNSALEYSVDPMGVAHINHPSVVGSIDSLRRLILMNRQQTPNLDREPGLLKELLTLSGFSQRLARLVSNTR